MDQGSSQISVGARIAAVAALAVALIVLLAALAGALSGDEGGDSSNATPGNGASTETAGSGSGPAKYEIQEGDTLSAIADETGVSVARIEQLNPGLDPQAITPGQTIRLR